MSGRSSAAYEMAMNLDDIHFTAEERRMINDCDTIRNRLLSRLERVGTAALDRLDCGQRTRFARVCLHCISEEQVLRCTAFRSRITKGSIKLPYVADEVIEKAFGDAIRKLPPEDR
jgi:hypothetical protein